MTAAIQEHSSHDCATASGQNAGDKSGHQSDSRLARVGNESAERSSDESSAPTATFKREGVGHG